MEEIEEDPPPTPLWVRENTTFLQGERRRQPSSSSSLFLNTGVLVMVLMLAAIVFLYAVVIPSFLNLPQKVIIKPSSVKKSWDSLNLVLVLFAIICGFLGRNNQSSDRSTTKSYEDVQRPEGVGHRNLPASDQWYEPPAPSSSRSRRMEYENSRSSSLMNSLRRNSSSYPDFQRESPWLTEADKWRFYDDSYLNGYRSLRSEDLVPQLQRSASGVDDDDSLDVKNIEVDTFVNRHQQFESMTTTSPIALSQQPPKPPPSMTPSPPPAPPSPAATASEFPTSSTPLPVQPRASSYVISPPPPPASYSELLRPSPPQEPTASALPPYRPQSINVHKKRTRQAQEARHQNRRERSDMKELERKRTQAESWPPSPPPPPPPPPPPRSPPPPMCELHSEAKSGRIRKKRGGVTVTKEILTSLYHQRKRKKKQRPRSHESVEAVVPRRQSNVLFPPPSPPPPPPPPPPPSSVFHNLFSTKKGKNKKIHSVSPPAPPTPPPPPRRLPASVSHPSKSKAKLTQIAPTKPSLPPRGNTDLSYGDETNSGNASPLVPIPPPPPPPPFKMPSWKFTVRGGYVKIKSNNNSPRSNSELDDDDEEALSSGKESPSPMAMGNRIGSDSPSPFSCPSPDVNTKADDFIARFRDKLKLERMDSIRQGNARSRLSYESNPSPSPSQHSTQKASSSRYHT